MAWKNPTLNLSQFTSYSGNTIFTGAATAKYVGFDISSKKERQSASLYNAAWKLTDISPNVSFTGNITANYGFDIKTDKENTKETNPTFKLTRVDSNVAFTGDTKTSYGFDIKTETEASSSNDKTGIYNPTYRTNWKHLTDYDNSKQFPTKDKLNDIITFGSNNTANGFDIKNTAEDNLSNSNLIYNTTNPDNVKNYQINQFNYGSTAINGSFINPVDRLDTNQNINLKLWQGVSDPAPASNVDKTTAALFLAGYATTTLEGQASQAAGTLIERSLSVPVYNTLDVTKTRAPLPFPGIKYLDFRAARLLTNPASIRSDGANAAARGGGFNARALTYALAAAGPTGAYVLFNLDGYGKSGYGWGDHDNRFANRRDFTLGSLVTTKWDSDEKKFFQTVNWLERATPFRGDKVTVIDFGKRQLENVYQWRPRPKGSKIRDIDQTQDFIKFYFTGPALYNGAPAGATDNIIAFRAIITSLSDRFSPNWVSGKILGRADETHTYQGYSRDLDMQFTVYATDRDELKPIWRKLNGLAGYTAPIYDGDSSAMIAPWLRITIGDLFVQQPIIIQSLTYTLHDNDTTWETNLENDRTMMQTPHKIDVSIDFKLITDALPQNEGSFYTLAKQFDQNGTPMPDTDNWLSDFNFGVLNNNEGPSGDKAGKIDP
jgi:hypothetical protein